MEPLTPKKLREHFFQAPRQYFSAVNPIYCSQAQFDKWVKLGLIKTHEDPNKWTDWLRDEYKKTGN